MQLSSQARKAVAMGLTASTMLWASVMGLAPLAASAAVHSDGCLVLSGGVVWLISGGVRRGFTSAEVFASHGYNFSQVVSATAEDAALPAGAIMTYADGTLVKGPSDPLVYLVAGGQKRGFTTGSVFTGLGYSFSNIQQAPANTFADLPTGAHMDSTTMAHPAGTRVISGGAVWLMTSNGRMGYPSGAVFTSYGIGFEKVVNANAADLAMGDQGAVSARAACTGGSEAPVSGNVNVSLAASSPVAGTVIAGQALADLAHFAFTGSGTVTSLNLKRLGVSADSTLSNVYLFDGNVRITDAATVSSGNINFNNSAGLFVVNGSKTISVRSDIAASTSGQTVGVQVSSTGLSAGVAAGVPAGNMHTIAALPSNFSDISFNTTTTPSADANITAQDDFVMWQNVVTVSNYKAAMKSIRLRQTGSVNRTDLGNFRFYVDGVQVGSSVAQFDADGYASFDFGSGVMLETGSRTLKMVGNIIAGANRNFIWSLRSAADILVVDQQFNQAVLVEANNTTFSARTTGTQTIGTGTLTFTKRTDSPSGNIVIESNNIVYGKFDVKAAGENMKVESLDVSVTESDSATAFTLRNGRLFLDGVQVGSTASVAADTDSTQAYTRYTFGSSFVVNAGQTRVLEVRADVYDDDGTDNIEDADTLRINLETGSSNVQRMTSLGYANGPTADVNGNTLTVATGSITVALDTSYANQTVVVPRNNFKIGSYTLQASSTEGANLNSFVIDFDEVADVFDASDDLSNMYFTITRSGSVIFTSAIKATVADTANTYSTNVTINAGETLVVNLYADLASTAGDGGSADTAESSLTLSYITSQSSTSTTASEVDGQTITAGSGTFTTALDGSSPLNRIVAGNQLVDAAKFKISTTNDSYQLKEMQVKVASATVSSAIVDARLYYGDTLLATAPFAQSTNTAALFTGLDTKAEALIAANTNKVFTVKLMLNQIGTGFGSSQQDAKVTLDSVSHISSLGTQATDATDRAGNELYVYKSIPTISAVDLSNTSALVNGQAQDLYKFTVTANSNGAVALKQFILTTAWSDGGTADTLEVESLKLFEDGVDVTDRVTIQDEEGNTVESTSGMLEADEDLTVSYSAGNESVVAAGTTKTYTVRGTPSGFRATGADTVGDSVSFSLIADTAHNSTKVYLNGTSVATTLWGLHTSAAATGSGTLYELIWSDNSSNAHVASENASSTGDWANSYKVLNLDLAGETWTK